MTLRSKLIIGTAIAALGWAPAARAAAVKEVQMLHWWTSGGEAAALNVLKKDLGAEGYTWKDVPVAGGGGDAAMTALKAMAAAGNYPTASQMLGYTVLDYAGAGKMGDISDLALKEGWDKVVPAPLQKFSKKAFNDLDADALKSPMMKASFDNLKKLTAYVDPNYSGRDWNLATAMVIKGDALMQVMGDWAKGEFKAAGKTAGQDFLCPRFPGTDGTVV